MEENDEFKGEVIMLTATDYTHRLIVTGGKSYSDCEVLSRGGEHYVLVPHSVNAGDLDPTHVIIEGDLYEIVESDLKQGHHPSGYLMRVPWYPYGGSD